MVENIVGCKWSLRLLQLCADGTTRPSALQRECPGLSAKVMNERLRKLMRYGIVERHVCGSKPPLEVDYRLTAFGRRFHRILDEIRQLQLSLATHDESPWGCLAGTVDIHGDIVSADDPTGAPSTVASPAGRNRR